MAAALVRVEPATVVEHLDDVGLVIDDDHRRRAQAQAADFAGAVEVQRRVEFLLGEEAHAHAAGDDRFRLAAFPDAARVFVDQRASGDAHRQFVTARLVDVAADAIQLRPVAAGVARIGRVGRHAHRLEPLDAPIQDVRHAGERLDVVHDRRLAEQPLDGRKRRLDPRPRALAFEAFDQPGLLAADVRSRPAVQIHVEVFAAAENVLAEQIRLVAILDRLLECSITATELVPQIDVGRAALDRVAGDGDPLNDLMRIALHDDAVVERPRLGLIGVDREINRRRVLRQERPLHAGRKPRPASASQPRCLDGLRDLCRSHLQRLFERSVAAIRSIGFECRAVRLADSSQQNWFKSWHVRSVLGPLNHFTAGSNPLAFFVIKVSESLRWPFRLSGTCGIRR